MTRPVGTRLLDTIRDGAGRRLLRAGPGCLRVQWRGRWSRLGPETPEQHHDAKQRWQKSRGDPDCAHVANLALPVADTTENPKSTESARAQPALQAPR